MDKIRTSETHRIRVDFVRSGHFQVLNRLGMTFAPGKKQADALTGAWDRDLRTDLERLSNAYRVRTLISLLEDEEFEALQINDFEVECARAMIELVRFPIRDVSVPDSMEDFVLMVAGAVDSLKDGNTVVTHCKGGLGRAGLAAACIVVAATDAGISANEAIEIIREARPGSIETAAQEQFVNKFENEWRAAMAKRGSHYLLYWQERSVHQHAANDMPLDVVASNGLFGIEPGDTIWIVTLTKEREFLLAGRLIVGEVVEYEEAIRRMPDAGLWQAEYYAFPEPGTEEFMRLVPLTEIAEDLRFESENDRLTVRDGRINPQQLRELRELTPESVVLVTSTWEESAAITDPEKLAEIWQVIVSENPDDPRAHYNFGVALSHLKRNDEAIREYETTIRLDPNYFPALYNLGNQFIFAERYEDAIEKFNRAMLVDGEYAPAYFMLGVAYYEAGRPDDAIAITRQGLEIDPDDESAYYNLAYWAYRMGDYNSALARCDDLIGRTPLDQRIRLLKGKCFRGLGDLESEIQAYKDVIAISDTDGWAVDLEALYALGAAWERKITGSDTGIEYLEVHDKVDLDNPREVFYFAMAEIAQGKSEFAHTVFDMLRHEAPDLAHRLEYALEQTEITASNSNTTEQNMLKNINPDEQAPQPILTSDDQVDKSDAKLTRKSQPRRKILLNILDEEIVAKNNPDLYFQVLRILVEKGTLEGLVLPVSYGRKRNFLSRTPVHKDGSTFLAPVEFCGYYMESHSSREQGMKMLRTFLEDLGIETSVPNEEVDSDTTSTTLLIPSNRERVLGSLLGLAVCDALGTTAEFNPSGTFPEITSIVGGGPFGLNPGEWTDDTSMALCLAESLVESGGFNAQDQMERYLRWKNEGHLSSNGRAFDIGNTIRTALNKYEKQTDEKTPYCGSVSPTSAGNGSLMRLAPIALYFADDPRLAIAMAAESSRTTHGARECLDACRYFAGLIVGVHEGRSKDEILSPAFSPVPGLWEAEPLSDRIAEVANGIFKNRKPPQITNTGQGYVVLSLHAALWAFHNSRSFSEGALKVVNLGYDSDTYGAIYGQLAGAFYGNSSIPNEWLETLAKRELIEYLAIRLVTDR